MFATAANGTARSDEFASLFAMKPACSTIATRAAGRPTARMRVY